MVEVSPIKIYPLRWVGNRMNADIKKELDNVNENLNKHITDSEMIVNHRKMHLVIYSILFKIIMILLINMN